MAQNHQYKFKSFTPKDGLSQTSVIDIAQDTLGQIWVATRDGLNKYDGNSFKIYRHDEADSTSISNSDILALEEDSSGMLWVGTYNGLNRYNPVTDNFDHFLHSNEKSSIPSNTVWKIKEIKDEIWIGTLDGLAIYNKKTGAFLTVHSEPENPNSLPGKFIFSIYETQNGTIWLGTENGLCKLISRNQNQFTFQRFDYRSPHNSKAYRLYVKEIIEDKSHNLWVATKHTGLYKIKANSTELVSINNIQKYQSLDKDIRALSIDRNNNLWIGSYIGISLLNNKGELKKIGNKTNQDSGLSKIKTIYTDKNGSVWLGSYYGGLHLWDKANTNFINYNQFTKPHSLNYNVVGAIAANDNQVLFLGTEGGGITKIDLKTNKSTNINVNNTKGFLSDNIKSLIIIGDVLWVGSFNSPPFLYNYKQEKVIPNNFPKFLINEFQDSSVYVFEKESDSIIWLGTFGEGVLRYNTNTNTYTKITMGENKRFSLTNRRTRAIHIDSKRRVWIGTQSGLNLIALADIDHEQVPVEHFFFDSGTLSGVDILTIFEDSKQQIWVGTKSNGFFKFNGVSFEKVKLNKNQVVINSVHAILEDAQQNLWLSSNHGIIKYNSDTGEIINYDQTDGLISNEYNDNSALNFNNERLYFGGPAGVTSFNPEAINVNNYNPQVVLTDLKIKNESVKIGGPKSILDKNIAYTKTIELPYNKANFSINFAIPNFINATNNSYMYRLTGLEDTWNLTTNNQVNYIIQNPGTYIFEVKGANNDGIWNKVPTTLTIKVQPAPWRSWWAFLIYGALIGLTLITLLWFLKSKEKLKHELELEFIEKKRNEEINHAKLQFFTNISHEFRTPLTLILGPLQQIIQDYKGSNKMYKKLLVIENNANHLLHLINRLMDFRKLENNQFNLQAAEGNIVKFMREIYLSFTEYAKNGNYNYTFETSNEHINVYYDRNKLERVFYNLISNAFRYTPKGGVIKIKIFKEPNHIFIDVNDSGVGIAPEYKDKIFDRFFDVPIHNQPQKNYNQGSGIGLSIAKNIALLHKGNIILKDKESSGSVFRVVLPLGRTHLKDSEILNNFKRSDDISQYEIQLKDTDVTKDSLLEDLALNKHEQTILVVEDSKPLRVFIKNLLQHQYNILEAENGKIALKLAYQNLPDLIISDVIMPEMVGTELCAKVKEDIKTSHIPVVLLTSRSALIYKFEGLESGADEYISKPFNVKEFQLRIKNLLDNSLRLKNKFSNVAQLAPSEITITSLDEKLLKKAFKIVETNLGNDQFDVITFSEELGVSRTTLFSKIKAWTNFTPNEFIQEIRLKHAAQLIESNKLNISQISYKVGFKNPKYFSKCFRKKFKETPTQYQNRFSEKFNN
ncbi:hybrid sensor histidine kinase/response regulator transcription factor [Algibacter pacificus]|uniref:hybrid sensor histidine kinase/response regulator transcription factor n=1 Tax=Algibacter pacificus TaxID=2599389 RepID=UPI001FEB52B2|nr:hybrid sensor histidine kinase/response regulator transcription factor [Algibacter pacificus]